MSNVKISGFYDEASQDLRTQLSVIKSFGESYLCPRGINGKNIADYTAVEFAKDVKPILDEYGVKFSSIGSPIGKIDLYDDEAYENQKKKLAELVKICQIMDCKYIRMFSFKVSPDGNYNEYFPIVIKKLKGFLEIVKGTNVILLHENEKHIYGDVPDRVIKIYKEINDSQFQLCFDASNYIQCNVDAPKAYEMLKDHIVYYHIKDCSPEKVEVPLGHGIGGYENMIYDLIVNRKYDGFMTLEPHTGKYAKGKIPCNLLCWLTCFIKPLKYWHKVFRRIDKEMGIGLWQSVDTKTIMTWQHDALVKMIKEAEAKGSKVVKEVKVEVPKIEEKKIEEAPIVAEVKEIKVADVEKKDQVQEEIKKTEPKKETVKTPAAKKEAAPKKETTKAPAAKKTTTKKETK